VRYVRCVNPAPVAIRELGRHAVRAELASVAFNRFCLTGFNQVTFADLSQAAGVSRSTFLRYFGTKEDVVLFVFDPVGDVIVDALDASMKGADQWTRLRSATKTAMEFLLADIPHLVTILGLVEQTPALRAHLRDKQAGWRAGIAARLLGDEEPTAAERLGADVRVAVALECLWISLGRWTMNADDAPRALLDVALDAVSATAGPAPATPDCAARSAPHPRSPHRPAPAGTPGSAPPPTPGPTTGDPTPASSKPHEARTQTTPVSS